VGWRFSSGNFGFIENSYLRSGSSIDKDMAWHLSLLGGVNIARSEQGGKSLGLSVRCVQNDFNKQYMDNYKQRVVKVTIIGDVKGSSKCYEYAKDKLNQIGVKVVNSKDQDIDIEVVIDIFGYAEYKEYTSENWNRYNSQFPQHQIGWKKFCRAYVYGYISVVSKDYTSSKKKFYGRYDDCSYTLDNQMYRNEDEAPFEQAITYSNFKKQMDKVISKLNKRLKKMK
jgi:hypothetical protein